MTALTACPPPTQGFDDLSDREHELLAMMASGLSNAGISRALYLSPKTVETHVRSIFMKLGLPPASAAHRRVLAVLMYLEATGAIARPQVEFTRPPLQRVA